VALEDVPNESQPLLDAHVRQEDQARVRPALAEDQRAEVLVQRNKDASLLGSKLEELFVTGIGIKSRSLENVVTVPSQPGG
jgi:hypothetical protein